VNPPNYGCKIIDIHSHTDRGRSRAIAHPIYAWTPQLPQFGPYRVTIGDRFGLVVRRTYGHCDPRIPSAQTADDRLPPGQYLIGDLPVLSAGPTPRVPLDAWAFTIRNENDDVHEWSWQDLTELPIEELTVDIHCVTGWSKLDTACAASRWTFC
jgi:molybdopterin-dependent oxidoreductase-like protein protein